MSTAYYTNGEKKGAHRFSWENRKEDDHWEDVDIKEE
jgi:hypothetical protein